MFSLATPEYFNQSCRAKLISDIGKVGLNAAVSMKQRIDIGRKMAEEVDNNVNVENPDGTENLKVLENIDVNLTVEVGRTEITIRDLLRLNEGSVVELDRLAGDPLDIMVNNTKIAKGEVVMVGERFGVRFGEIVDPEKRMESI